MEENHTQNSRPTPADADELLHMVNGLARDKKLPALQKLTQDLIASGQGESFVQFIMNHTLDELAASKFCPVVDDEAPDWAKQAAQMVLASLLPQHRKRKASQMYNIGFESGYMNTAAELIASDLHDEYGRLLLEMSKTAQSKLKIRAATELPPEVAHDFFKGIADGNHLMRAMPERARQMAQRTKIFSAIATHWKEIAPGVFHSTGQLHKWLLSQKLILPGTDSCEIRLVCAKIGLRYKKPGKPPKS